MAAASLFPSDVARQSPWLPAHLYSHLLSEAGAKLAGAGRVKVMTYVDGFVAAVPAANREAFRKHAEAAAAVFKEYGALKVVECCGGDVPEGEVTSFPMAVKPEGQESHALSDAHGLGAEASGRDRARCGGHIDERGCRLDDPLPEGASAVRLNSR